mgnify:CR=1 FL=1
MRVPSRRRRWPACPASQSWTAIASSSEGFSSSSPSPASAGRPCPSTSTAPARRSSRPSVIAGSSGRASSSGRSTAVGAQAVNSMSRSSAPARSAMAAASPVAVTGAVVRGQNCSAPPPASTTTGASQSTSAPSERSARRPATRPSSSVSTSTPRMPVSSRRRVPRRPAMVRTADARPRCTWCPVVSWRPGRVASARSRSSATLAWTSGAVLSRWLSARRSATPRPLRSASSGSWGPAHPSRRPVEIAVAPSSSVPPVTSAVSTPAAASCMAAPEPAAPAPTTTTRARLVSPGSGAPSCRADRIVVAMGPPRPRSFAPPLLTMPRTGPRRSRDRR